MTLEQAIQRVHGLLDNDRQMREYVATPKEKCEAAASLVVDKLRQAGIAFEVRGMLLWDKAAQEAPNNHFVVVANVDGHRLCIDMTAHQFSGANQAGGPIVADERSWEERFLAQEKTRNRTIKFKDFSTLADARGPLTTIGQFPLLSDQDWAVLGSEPGWARDLIRYPGWGRDSLLFQHSLSGPASTLPTAEQRAATEKALTRRFDAEVRPFKELEAQIDAGAYDIPARLDTRQTLIDKAGAPEGTSYEAILQQLDRYHADADGLSLAQKTERLGELALLADQYAASHTRNLNDRAARMQDFAKSVRGYAIGLRRRDGALEGLHVPQAWRQPAPEGLAQLARSAPETDAGLGYRKQLIVQLQGDDNSFQAAQSLFGKHPRHSEWLQLQGDAPDSLGWDGGTQSVRRTAPLQLDAEGRVRIVLVGHGLQQGGQQLFGGRSKEQLQAELGALLQRLPANKVRGIHLDLVGCQLMDSQRSLAETLPGQMGDWLMRQGKRMGIPRSGLSLSAREYPVRVTADGHKEVLTEEWGWLGKESARLKDVLHKVELEWDAQANRLVRRPPSPEALAEVGLALQEAGTRPLTSAAWLELGRAIEDAAQQSGLSAQTQETLHDLHLRVGDRLRQHLFDKDAPAAEHRTAVEQHAVKNARFVALGERWADAVQGVQREAGLAADAWLPTLETRRTADGGSELLFVNRTAQAGSADGRRWVRADAAIFTEFQTEAAGLLRELHAGVGWREGHGLSMRRGLNDASAAHTLNAAYMLQTLMDVNPRNGGLGALSDALKVQVYAQLVQNGLGMATDAAQMATWVHSALGQDLGLLSRTGQLLGVIGGSAGALLDGINIGAIIAELMQTTDPTARIAVETKLGLAVVNSGVSLGALLAGVAGAGTAAGVLGVLATPLAGLSVGIPVLVDNYQRLRNGFDQASQRFNDIMDSIAHPGLYLGVQAWQVKDGAVVEQLDFLNGTMRYGSVEVNATRGGSAHTVTGGWDHFFARPDPDTHQWLDVYTGLGMTDKQYTFRPVSHAAVERTVILPSGVGRRIRFDYNQVTGRRAASAEAFRRLHQHYREQFIWGMYAFPTDWGISSIVEEPRPTAVSVILDAEARTLIVPTVANATERGQLSYALLGHGGVYSVVLPAEAVPIHVEASAAQEEKWVFDLDYVVKQHTVQDGKLVLGALKQGAFAGMRIGADAITVAGQTLSFRGENRPSEVLLTHTLEAGASLCLSVDLEAQSYTSTLLLEQEPSAQMLAQLQRFFAEADTPGLSGDGWVGLVVGARSGAIQLSSGDAWLVESAGGTTMVWQRQQGQVSQWSLPGVAMVSGASLTGTFNVDTLSANFSGVMVGAHLLLHELGILAQQDVEAHAMDGLLQQWREQGLTRDVANAWLAQRLGSDGHIALIRGALLQGRDAAGRRLAYRLESNGGVVLKSAVWEEGGANYVYRTEQGARWLEISAQPGQATLEALSEDPAIPGLASGVDIVLRPGEATHWLKPGAWALARSHISIVTDELPGTPVHLVLPGQQGAYRWQLDGSDLLLVNGDHHVKLLNMVGTGREGRLSALSLSFDNGEAWRGSEVFRRLNQAVSPGDNTLFFRPTEPGYGQRERDRLTPPGDLAAQQNGQKLVQAMNAMAPATGSELSVSNHEGPGVRPLLTRVL